MIHFFCWFFFHVIFFSFFWRKKIHSRTVHNADVCADVFQRFVALSLLLSQGGGSGERDEATAGAAGAGRVQRAGLGGRTVVERLVAHQGALRVDGREAAIRRRTLVRRRVEIVWLWIVLEEAKGGGRRKEKKEIRRCRHAHRVCTTKRKWKARSLCNKNSWAEFFFFYTVFSCDVTKL